jgi:hypothetical protein
VRTTINFGITVPKPAFEELERRRGYYSRSKFILMALDALAQTMESVQPVQVCRHDQADGRASTQTPKDLMIDHE